MDEFAQIAASGIGGRMEYLEEPAPVKKAEKEVKLEPSADAPVYTHKKMTDVKELRVALNELKEKYKPYLQELAPNIPTTRKRYDIKSFLCDGQEVSIPEYGGPLGKAKKIYETTFNIDAPSDDEAVYIHFEGADYITAVSVNGMFAGCHEGFFSPFEFDITDIVNAGENTLKIELFNDYKYIGNVGEDGEKYYGDKLYAATGLGWDDPKNGWHHCPPGMGIYNDVYIEIRKELHISDIFVRPMEDRAEAWIEVEYHGYQQKEIVLDLSLYGQNFSKTIFENMRYEPNTVLTVGMCDTLTEAQYENSLGKGITLYAKHGKNVFKVPFEIENPKKWDLETPYLYQLQASLIVDGNVTDYGKRTFGMRSFIQDTDSTPKGMFYLNGRPIRLRGANTMGFEQQDVLRGDYEQLIEDILLAKLCNMNFFRLTQRPVQTAVYDYCNKLGLMTQTDLPLFGAMRRNKMAEGIRQAEEMERHIRSHPCNVIISYINEPFPNANNEPHRNLERHELEGFFECCDITVRMCNPDRVIKHIDGDYDPPTTGMPDNHCYPMWYNAHGIDIGRLNKGYWIPVRKGWYYGCGEYGAEGLECAEIMRKYYPKEWLEEPFEPGRIIGAQTAPFHYFFYDTPDSIEEWVEKSQNHQAFATRFMTEAFRRDNRMVSQAIHLFIDAWPSGWMKTIMDCERNPKKAFFAYRDSLEPVMVSLRSDRFAYTVGEKVKIEAYLCNDTMMAGKHEIVFELYDEAGKLIKKTTSSTSVNPCCAEYCSTAVFDAETTLDRERLTLKAILLDENQKAITYNTYEFDVFADCEIEPCDDVVIVPVMEPGTYDIAGEKIVVKGCGMLPMHFVSRNTGHKAIKEFNERDFSYWYDKNADMIMPILSTTFTAEGFTPILTSGNMDDKGKWSSAMAAAEKTYEGKKYVICQVDLRMENPVAKRFLRNLYRI